jgi:hypothetical protein
MLRRNMIELKANSRAARSFAELVEQLGLDAVASPKRSTVPLLDYWRQPAPRLRVLEAHLGLAWSEQTELHFEYEVPVQQGRGKSSYTDLMILGDDVAVAIEAKFTDRGTSPLRLGSRRHAQRTVARYLKAGFGRLKPERRRQSIAKPSESSHIK